jgi:2-alkenal reductase
MSRSTSKVLYSMFRRFVGFTLLLLAFLPAGCDLGSSTAGQAVSPTGTPLREAGAPTTSSAQSPETTRFTTTAMPTIQPQPTLAAGLSTAITDRDALLVELYRRASPAVVSVEVLTMDQEALPEDHPSIPPIPRGPNMPFAQGSGFLFDSQGHIITNNHVVEDANELQVVFADGSSIGAQVVGRDPGSDLAVLKVDQLPDGAAPLSIGDAREIEVGETAIAIGNPFGLQNTLTVGVISGVGRSLIGPQSMEGTFSIPNVIQTDAAINPGNSGGPLLNVRGEVIGVNTAIRSENGIFAGVGYAVPSSAISRIVPVLIAEGSYRHPYIGISMRSIDSLLAREFDLPASQGALVVAVQDGSPADRADLQAGTREVTYNGFPLVLGGDIITAINGEPVVNSDDLISYLALETSVEDTITLTILRDGQQRQVEVTLAQRPR